MLHQRFHFFSLPLLLDQQAVECLTGLYFFFQIIYRIVETDYLHYFFQKKYFFSFKLSSIVLVRSVLNQLLSLFINFLMYPYDNHVVGWYVLLDNFIPCMAW